MGGISAIDRDALSRAVIACRAQSNSRRRQIDAMLADPNRSWESVAKFCAFSSQIESLGLKPHECAPVWARSPDLQKPFGDPRGEREAAETRKKLRELGLSTFESDPVCAIAEAERRQRAD
ncbi:hypothetical protein JQ636_37940 [Bradyrhizobium japonicum]|uniref:hypothetical protein n=1 Tax=Bradyrhizobium japonicum TaxID=375 RepID=UPI001BA551D1|nr:hypothetical protein [Bradyrhizobium japonicum]MBR0809345.1 hypothetical protein [Bradyrhizobium japonicum]